MRCRGRRWNGSYSGCWRRMRRGGCSRVRRSMVAGDGGPADPFEEDGHPVAGTLEGAKALSDALDGIEDPATLALGLLALSESELRAMAFERSLRVQRERRRRAGGGTA